MTKPVALRVFGALTLLLAGCGGSNGISSSTTTTTVPATASLANLSATVSSQQDGTNVVCTDPVRVTVNLTNTAHATVLVTGIRRHQTSVLGDCNTLDDFTYPTITTSIGTGSAAVLNNTQLFYPGSGCCSRFPCSAFCQVGFSFTVMTSVGEVNAGVITYGLTFNNQCAQCSSSSLGALNCPSRR